VKSTLSVVYSSTNIPIPELLTVSGTESPKNNRPEAPEWLISNIAEASQNVRNIYVLYIGFLAYCGLTVASTTDRQLILNEPVSLPLLKVDVSLNGFFILAPLLAILLFTYMQLYLSRITGLKNDLHTHYAPVGPRRLYPWLLNIAEDPEPGSIGKLQKFTAHFSLWWPMPIVLLLNALWFLKKHDPIMSYVLGFLPVLGTAVVLYFWHHHEYRQTTPGSRVDRMLVFFGRNPRGGLMSAVTLVTLLLFTPLIATLLITSYLHFLKVFSFFTDWLTEPLADIMKLGWGGDLVLTFFLLFVVLLAVVYFTLFVAVRKNRALVFLVNLVYVYSLLLVFIIVPWANAGGFNVDLSFQAMVDPPETDYPGVYWVNLQGVRMERGNLNSAVLKRADLRNAHLQGARLGSANLIGADLRGASLQGANFNLANLESANLADTKLGGGSFQGANLSNAILRCKRHLCGNFRGVDLSGTVMNGAYLDHADFTHAKNLSVTEVRSARNWPFAYYSKDDIERLGLRPDHNRRFTHWPLDLREVDLKGVEITATLRKAKLQGANLEGAILTGIDLNGARLADASLFHANLQGASLLRADLSRARLNGANLRNALLGSAHLEEADLRETQGLTIRQLAEAKTLYQAKLDSKSLNAIREEYPHLLEKPSTTK
jgi:uncharacterized protein YjbI with pentapeptide repeats